MVVYACLPCYTRGVSRRIVKAKPQDPISKITKAKRTGA
jgi:hypothetical protein